ncbi:ABC transporter substrate-binding protein [Actinoplanes lobatus]|uniref:Polar amino acid transport system substrate-binding protein n=2 Tax=Actinoplanes lobatus TaxID=113568 RepID=A0A7W7HD38_9ACTN|nr:ABC transporter substrate-binding protein [Actinoplanes lobatus]MBB4748334.1 polar amino acid transport system substrate-binding protein [Actinoplanes lobatus]
MRRLMAAAGVLLMLVTGACSRGGSDEQSDPFDATAGVAVDPELHDRLPESVRNTGFIRLVTDASYAPMEYFAADGRTIIGFEPDLAAALGGVLGIRAEMVVGPFNTALDDVVAGTYDGVLSMMTDTAERREQADFVNYFHTGTSIVVQRGNPQGISDLNSLCGKVVATEKGTFQETMLRGVQKTCGNRSMTIADFPTNADALVQLRTGRAAAVLNDFPAAMYLATAARTSAFFEMASDEQYEVSLLGIAVSKENSELRNCLQAALDRLITSGVYTELLTRWGLNSGAIPAAMINGQPSKPAG